MSTIDATPQTSLKNILEALLLASGEPLTVATMAAVFSDEERPSNSEIGKALQELESDYAQRGLELKEVASGFRLQVRQEVHPWVSRLWEERPQRYSRALLETLALIAYRQPITRGDIEEVRGVSVRSSIIRTLQEREWIRVVGHRDVPGKPALFGTTRVFLDYFNIKSLDDLPSLAEIMDMGSIEPELDFEPHPDKDSEAEVVLESEAQDNSEERDSHDRKEAGNGAIADDCREAGGRAEPGATAEEAAVAGGSPSH